ncbi:MAG: uroporphyrinogen-III synthase [Anaerolineae bacterium]|nr:uroporphyrinogen-III synthase [Anaerolineae bacterium]
MSSLLDKRIVITRPTSQYAGFTRLLQSYGAVPIHFPTIQIAPMTDPSPLQHALRRLPDFDWLIFTSANGVQAFNSLIPSSSLKQYLQYTKIAAVGPKTARALRDLDIQPDFVPSEYLAAAILPGLGNVAGKRLLLLRADIARPELPQALQDAHAIVEDIPVYSTVPAQLDPCGLDHIKTGVDLITFTSPSTVVNFIALVQQAGLDHLQLPNDPGFACIGPVTLEAAQKHGMPVAILAGDYTIEGLTEAIMDYFTPIRSAP